MKRRLVVGLLVLVAGAAYAFLFRAGGGALERPSIILVTLDTTRSDHLSCYGYFRETSPALDALAEESIVFDRCLVPQATTLPSHTSILTGTYPLEHGVLANMVHGGDCFVPSPGLRPFTSFCEEAGYGTAAFVSAAPLKRGTGIEEGFQTFDQPTQKQRNAKATTDRVISWLRTVPERPFFLWVHYYDPHAGFNPPPPYDEMFQTDDGLEAFIEERKIPPTAPRPLAGSVDDARVSANLYDGEIRFMDSQIALLLDELRAMPGWDETILLVVGDHGEGLCQHGEAAHGGTWEEQLRAPLILRVPGEAPRRVSRLVSVVDVIPTMLGFVSGNDFDGFLRQTSGRDVLARRAETVPLLGVDTGRLGESETYRICLTGERWKYFHRPNAAGRPDELYDLHADPHELANLRDAYPDVAGEMKAEALRLYDAQSERGERLRGGAAPETAPLDSTIVEELKALGYVSD